MFPSSLQGGIRENEPNTPKAVGKSSGLTNGDLSSVFLTFCPFSKSTLVVNCALEIAVQVQFYTSTRQLSKLIPYHSELLNRNSFTRKGLFHASEMGYRFPGFTEHSAPEIFQLALQFNLGSLLKTRALYSLQLSCQAVYTS